jgi:IclR family mhp operon transcriptional activator
MAQQAAAKSNGGVRAVERAIDILQALNRRPLSTLHDLHCETGLPKPSIVRLLRTLEGKGLATQSSSYGTYQLLGRVRSLSSGFHHEPMVIEIAEEIMIDLTKREGWPLALALFDLDAMVVRASTIPYTSLSLLHSSLNKRLSLVGRALGRCFLAHSSPAEQQILIEMLKHSDDPEDLPARNPEAMARIIEPIRANGYATRDPLFEPRSITVAVPVRDNGRVVASLGITWIRAAMTLQEGLDRHLQQLFDAADTISRELAARAPQTPRYPRMPMDQDPAELFAHG